ncbi:hypothetical protein PANNVG_01622 [Pantoea sp. Nvir]|uniref:hypothetical protein n=1 Tax=unclassified Pantoea TaxID=2630326 RepID=UPI001EF477A1|nr:MULTISPECIES: hypothetical protein [unclassified Pantoea]MCG7367885.1 hypothetical protein [Pantoea sp. ACRSH]MCG7398244.1 hypothetical protein [Pantoea sp. ACRSC]
MSIIFVPPLIAVLLSKEIEKGFPLTEEEVNTIRDNATAIVVDANTALALVENRGYRDINPEKCWEEWVDFRRDR